MRTLADRLTTLREGAKERIAPEHLKTMHRATAELTASGIAERAVSEGDEAPGFELPDTAGTTVSLASLLAKGPLVLTFFRGHW